jgi:hypothetical protein
MLANVSSAAPGACLVGLSENSVNILLWLGLLAYFVCLVTTVLLTWDVWWCHDS